MSESVPHGRGCKPNTPKPFQPLKEPPQFTVDVRLSDIEIFHHIHDALCDIAIKMGGEISPDKAREKLEKIVYVAHPLAGDTKSNAEKVEKICRIISSTWRHIVPVSPILTFNFLEEPENRELALKYCLKLLDRCDELWLYGDWQKSEGCLLEKEHALKRGIKVIDQVNRIRIVA